MAAELDLVALLLVLAHVVLGGVATVLVSANRRPSAAIAWVLMIIFVPFIGAVAFLLIGLSKLPKGRREKQRLVNKLMEERTQGLDTLSHGEEWPDWLASMVALNRNLGALPMVGGNELTLIDDYRGAIQAMATAVDRAEQYVHVEFFILVHDEATAPFFAAPWTRRANGASPSGCCRTTSPAFCTRGARRRAPSCAGWVRNTTRCCPSGSGGGGSALTYATTGSCWWWTAGSGSPGRRT